MDRANRIKEIIEYKQRRLDELADPNEWERITKNMECGEYKEFKQHCIDEEIIIAALREQETVTNRNGLGWISVKDDLPKKEGSYIVATKNGGVVITHYYPQAKSFSSRRLNRLVTHWMERPAPPKEGADCE